MPLDLPTKKIITYNDDTKTVRVETWEGLPPAIIRVGEMEFLCENGFMFSWEERTAAPPRISDQE